MRKTAFTFVFSYCDEFYLSLEFCLFLELRLSLEFRCLFFSSSLLLLTNCMRMGLMYIFSLFSFRFIQFPLNSFLLAGFFS